MTEFNVGDEVYWFPQFNQRELPNITKVVRVTKTIVHTEDGRKWTVRGHSWGSSGTFHSNYLQHVDQEARADFALRKEAVAVRRLKATETIKQFLEMPNIEIRVLEDIASQCQRNMRRA